MDALLIAYHRSDRPSPTCTEDSARTTHDQSRHAGRRGSRRIDRPGRPRPVRRGRAHDLLAALCLRPWAASLPVSPPCRPPPTTSASTLPLPDDRRSQLAAASGILAGLAPFGVAAATGGGGPLVGVLVMHGRACDGVKEMAPTLVILLVRIVNVVVARRPVMATGNITRDGSGRPSSRFRPRSRPASAGRHPERPDRYGLPGNERTRRGLSVAGTTVPALRQVGPAGRSSRPRRAWVGG